MRHNVIKRIGDYKMAVISANPVAVNYSVEGVPSTAADGDRTRQILDGYAGRAAPVRRARCRRRKA